MQGLELQLSLPLGLPVPDPVNLQPQLMLRLGVGNSIPPIACAICAICDLQDGKCYPFHPFSIRLSAFVDDHPAICDWSGCTVAPGRVTPNR